ncbi:MAG: hypothetical protein S4CHLAM123_06840 [Chlamydiales bacterium]|nr:hypothetical protein [Chlamydiales bacterium]
MDLKIEDVIELLNVSEATLLAWLAEGKIPAYQLNNETRFSRTEIEDWLLQQKLETTLSNTSKNHMQFSLYRALYRGQVHMDIPGLTKEALIHNVMGQMGERFDLDPTVLTELFLDRERMMPTTLGHGIGVPHTRDFLLDTHYDVIEIVYPDEPIEYGALDGERVHTLFFLFASEDKHHLNLLAKLAHLNVNEQARAFFQTKPGKEQVLEYVKEWESSLNA